MFRYLVLLLGFCSMAQAQPIPLRVKMFPGAQALPVMAAASQGIFERHGLKVEVLFTVNSQEQRDGTFVRLKGMRENKDYKAAMLNPPFSVDAKAAGLRSMGRAIDLIGPYQASGTFVLRSWAKANADTLERYIAALIEGYRWAVSPANREAGTKILVERLKVTPEVAARTWELMTDAKFGLARDARFDMQGFRNVLALRAEIEGSWGGKPPAPERYVDLSYYENALKKIPR